ncbi:hypothetical protein DL96DRAFT_1580655 [Flagelloscypha sp. PMI_526]|nr:hypothetical protein DL96DRAFT_1580655 [Flagelloscypha sp. PMI_526]
MKSLRSNLKHLSLGLEPYGSILGDHENGKVASSLPLSTFPQLQILSLCMWHVMFEVPNWWTSWFKWIAQNFSQPGLPPNLDTLRLIIYNVDEYSVAPPVVRSPEMEQLSSISNIKIRCFLKSNGQYPQRVWAAADILRSYLKTWDEAGKLDIWVSDE